MSTQKKYAVWERATLAFMVGICCTQPAFAGTQGSYMNSRGDGKAVDSVKFVTSAGLVLTSTATSPYSLGSAGGPCARVNPSEAPAFPNNLDCNNIAQLLTGMPSKAYCQSKGAPNYVWSIQAGVSGGATADNPELEARLEGALIPQNCAEVEIYTEGDLTDAFSGRITVRGSATAGAAIWLRGFEYAGPPPAEGSDDPTFLATLKAEGTPRFDYLLQGPFVFDGQCGLPIPFTTETGHENLYFVTDTVALSYPFSLECPSDVIVACGETVDYPPVQVLGGCDPVTVTYDPPVHALLSGENNVTVTAVDFRGNIAECSFKVFRQAINFKGFFPPLDGTGGTCDSPLRTIKRGSNVPVKFMASCEGSILTTGRPAFLIEQCLGGNYQGTGSFTLVGNEWHFNWDTNGLNRGVYKLTAILQDGSEQFVYVAIK